MTERRRVLELFEQNRDYLEERIHFGIEANRKGWVKITVKDLQGNALPDAQVSLKQKDHDFRYGINLFLLDEMEEDEKNRQYRKRVAECFNMATLPFYWSSIEPEKGKLRYDKNSLKMYRRPSIDLCMEFCEQNGIEPREHGLAYVQHFPAWLRNEDVSVVKTEYARRCREISKRYASRINTIEVTNETLFGNTEHIPFFDDPDMVETCFKIARRFFPANQLCINDAHCNIWNGNGNNRDKYYMQIERAMQKGAEIDAIGMQFHMFMKAEDEYKETRKFYDPLHLYRILDTYGRLGKPVQITELTIPCYTDAREDEELQAELIEYLYSIWFSHKNVEQIVYWNLVDGYAFGEMGNMTSGENYYRGGLLRYDMTPKPAYLKIRELFQKKWHTELLTVTNGNGIANVKGFYGHYEVEIEYKGRHSVQLVHLKEDGQQMELAME